jgi:chromate transporter
MAAVTFQLGRESLMDIFTLLLAAASLILLLRYKLNSTWLILAGAAIGLLSLLWR